MNLQKKLDLIEQYRNATKFLSHSNAGIDYTVTPGKKNKSAVFNIEVSHGREESSKR